MTTNPPSTMPDPVRPLRNDAQVTSLALNVLQLFSGRKTLLEVARSALQHAFDEHFPTLGVTTRNAFILEPLWREDEGSQRFEGYRTDRLEDLLLDRCRGVQARRYGPTSFLSIDAGAEYPQKIEVSLDEVLQMLDEWGPLLLQCYQQHLTELWGQPKQGGANAWQQLSELFKQTLRRDCSQLASEASTTVQAVLDYPDNSLRQRALGQAATQACITFVYKDDSTPHPDDVLVLSMSRELGERTIALLYTFSGGIEVFDSPQAQENSWLGARASAGLKLRNYTPENDVFDALTLCLLERQLQTIDAIKAPDFADSASLELRLAQICDPVAFLGTFRSGHEARLSALQEFLPPWLQDAAFADRSAYSQLMSSLADLNRAGTFLTGIPAILDYADEALEALIVADDPTRGDVCVRDFEVTLQRNTNSGFEIVDPPFPAPRYQSTTKTFAQLALRNLDAFPYVPSRITYRGGEAPVWATFDYLRALTTRADIGKHYPELLQRQLLDDPEESSAREAKYGESLRVLLPLYALELKIQNSLTSRAYECVVAVLQRSVSDRQVAGHKVVVRPLAFKVRSNATADVVANMFVMGPEDLSQGPHVLFRPAADTPLLEFASPAELFNAIKHTGAVQASVLAGLSTEARSIYAAGGFQQPHLGRIILDDFDTLSVPPPAVMSSNVLAGDVCSALYRACAQALIEQAKRDSVSDAQTRWIGFKQFGWATFNVLLPFARGPLAVIGLLAQLLPSIDSLIQSENGENRWSSFAEVLMNLALVLIHAGSPLRDISQLAGTEAGAVNTALDAAVGEAQVSAVTPSPFGGKARLFFGWTSARGRFSARELANLDTFKVPAPMGGAWVTTGQYRGLYQKDSLMFSRVGGDWFRVSGKLEGVVIIDHAHPARTGPWLTSDGQGGWDYGYGPRLLGGAGLNARARRKVKALEKTAGDLLAGFQKKAVEAARMASGRWSAADIEDLIVRDALPFENCARAIAQMTQSLGDAAPLALIDELNDRALQLRALARTTRIQALMSRNPTSGAVEYLLQEDAIRIRQVGGRIDFSAGKEADFLQEYEIRDTANKALWYAHFHYLKKDAAAEAFSKAHLKTPGQRKQGLAFQKAQQQAGHRVDPILRENIGIALARQMFAASDKG